MGKISVAISPKEGIGGTSRHRKRSHCQELFGERTPERQWAAPHPGGWLASKSPSTASVGEDAGKLELQWCLEGKVKYRGHFGKQPAVSANTHVAMRHFRSHTCRPESKPISTPRLVQRHSWCHHSWRLESGNKPKSRRLLSGRRKERLSVTLKLHCHLAHFSVNISNRSLYKFRKALCLVRAPVLNIN